MELGTFLPYLKIGYRRGSDNGMADFLSRYPTFKAYVSESSDVQELPSELFDLVPESVPLFTHRLGNDDEWLRRAHYQLYESKKPTLLQHIWQAPPPEDPALLLLQPSVRAMFAESNEHGLLPSRIAALREAVTTEGFWAELGLSSRSVPTTARVGTTTFASSRPLTDVHRFSTTCVAEKAGSLEVPEWPVSPAMDSIPRLGAAFATRTTTAYRGRFRSLRE